MSRTMSRGMCTVRTVGDVRNAGDVGDVGDDGEDGVFFVTADVGDGDGDRNRGDD